MPPAMNSAQAPGHSQSVGSGVGKVPIVRHTHVRQTRTPDPCYAEKRPEIDLRRIHGRWRFASRKNRRTGVLRENWRRKPQKHQRSSVFQDFSLKARVPLTINSKSDAWLHALSRLTGGMKPLLETDNVRG